MLNYADSLCEREERERREEEKNTHKVHRKLLVIYEEHFSFERNIFKCLTNMSVKMRINMAKERGRKRNSEREREDWSASVNKR